MKKRIFYEEFDSFYYYHGTTANWEMQGFHFHKEYELILFMSPGASISIGNRVYQAGIGDLFLINNQEYHKTAGAPSNHYERYVLMFEPDFVKSSGQALNYPFTKYFEDREEHFSHKIRLSGETLNHIILLFEKIEKFHQVDGSGDGMETQIQKKLAVLELLVCINQYYDLFLEKIRGEAGEAFFCNQWEPSGDEYENRDMLPGTATGDRERIEQIKKYIADHIGEKLSQEELADKFYMNRHYLNHFFKRETGFTLGQYITNRKINRARKLLLQGFTVTETAIALSYHSESHFINTFKKLTGTTPKRFVADRGE